jgi:hypothetical protein
MLLRHSFIVIYATAFTLMVFTIHTAQCHSINVQSFHCTYDTIHIYIACTWHTPTCFSCPLLLSPCTPLCPPLYSLPLTWHPPVVIGIVHLPLRLLVNWPRLPNPSSSSPTLPKFPEPHLPRAQQWRPREYSGSWCPEQCFPHFFWSGNIIPLLLNPIWCCFLLGHLQPISIHLLISWGPLLHMCSLHMQLQK